MEPAVKEANLAQSSPSQKSCKGVFLVVREGNGVDRYNIRIPCEKKIITGLGHSWFRFSYLVLPILPSHDHKISCVFPHWLNGFYHLKMPCVCPATALLLVTYLAGNGCLAV